MKETELIRNFFMLIILHVIFPYLSGKLSALCQKYLPDFIRGLIKIYSLQLLISRTKQTQTRNNLNNLNYGDIENVKTFTLLAKI